METQTIKDTKPVERMTGREAAKTQNEAAYKAWMVNATPAEVAEFLAWADRDNRQRDGQAVLLIRIAETQAREAMENTNALVAALAELGRKIDGLSNRVAAAAQLKPK